MSGKDLDTQFREAYEKACNMTEALPQDVMLKIYAYYKQATSDVEQSNHHQSYNLRNAFKINAWMQVRHLSTTEAKQLYVDLINSITK